MSDFVDEFLDETTKKLVRADTIRQVNAELATACERAVHDETLLAPFSHIRQAFSKALAEVHPEATEENLEKWFSLRHRRDPINTDALEIHLTPDAPAWLREFIIGNATPFNGTL